MTLHCNLLWLLFTRKHLYWKNKLSRRNLPTYPLLSGASLWHSWCDIHGDDYEQTIIYLIVLLNMFLHNIILNPFLKSRISVSDLVTCFLSRSCIVFANKTTTIKSLLIYALILLYKQKIAENSSKMLWSYLNIFSCPGQLNRWHCQWVIKSDFWLATPSNP